MRTGLEERFGCCCRRRCFLFGLRARYQHVLPPSDALGFAVLHAITRGMSARAVMLGGVYAAVLVFGWPLLVLSLLGLAESTIGVRARVERLRGTPPAGT